uniref:ORF2 n=1 Tax=Symplocastrum muelleri NIVA-CYA 644 TaxID=2303159 RepID=A0A346GB64_9CYAN|nr:ORF2 [Symplocastrum muelleri NIVA-CYA 644]
MTKQQISGKKNQMSYQIKILSIDGGGIRAIIPCMILAEIEKRTQKPIFSLFDLIAGTSTGGITALGLTKPKYDSNDRYKLLEPPQAEYSAQNLLDLYVNHGAEMFYEPLIEQFLGEIDDIVRPRYSSAGIKDVLKRYLGETPMKQALKEVIIPSYDIEIRSPVFFTNKIENQETDSRNYRTICSGFTMIQAAIATSALPSYFPPYHLPTSQNPSGFYTLIDGGVFANNPANLAIMGAMIEAKKNGAHLNLDKILVVSLGTGSLTRKYSYDEAKNWGLLGWVQPLINVMLDSASEAIAAQLEQLLPKAHNNPPQYYRFQAFLSEELEALDNTKLENIRKIKEVASQIIEERNKDIDELCDQLLSHYSAPQNEENENV